MKIKIKFLDWLDDKIKDEKREIEVDKIVLQSLKEATIIHYSTTKDASHTKGSIILNGGRNGIKQVNIEV